MRRHQLLLNRCTGEDRGGQLCLRVGVGHTKNLNNVGECRVILSQEGLVARSLKSATSMLAIGVCGLSSGLALAQEVDEGQEAVGQVDRVGAVNHNPNEIVVTARRREERLQDVPVSVSVVGPERLEQANISDIEGLTAIEPGLSLTVGTIFPYAFLRGFGTGGTNELEQSLGKFVDQVSYPRDQDIRLPLFDIERVEVLRGPQVLLYGNSATAGAINIVNSKPSPYFDAGLSASYGFLRQEPQMDGFVNIPLADNVAFRVAGYYQAVNDSDTKNLYLDDARPQSEVYAIRPWLSFDLSDSLSVVLHGEYDKIDVQGGSLQETTQPLDPTVIPFRLIGRGGEKYLAEGTAPFFTFDGSALENHLYQADISYETSVGEIESITAFRESDSFSVLTLGPDQEPHFLTYTYQEYNQFTQEVRLTGGVDAFDWVVGAYYLRSRHKVGDATGVNLGALGRTGFIATSFGSYTMNNVRSKSWSVFADVTFRPIESLSIELGARYTDLDKKGGIDRAAGGPPDNLTFSTGLDVIGQFEDIAFNGVVGAILGTSLEDIPYGAIHVKEDYWQPQVVVQYDINPDNMIYAKFVRGAKGGGYDFSFSGPAADADDAIFRPEIAKAYELGIKGAIGNGTLAYSLIAYREDFDDLQTAVFNENSLILNNVGAARSEGVEASLTARAAPGLTIGGSVYYMDARYLDYQGAACNHIQNFEQGLGCRQDLTGAPTRFSSKWTGSLNVDYETTVGTGWNLETGFAVFARSKYNAGDADDPDQVQNAYAHLSSYIGISPEDEDWKVSLFGRNLTDKRVLMFGGNTPFNGTSTLSNLGAGREIGLRVDVNF